MSDTLAERMVKVWYVAAGDEPGGSSWSLLSPDELARADRFRHDDVRWLFVSAHALVRRTLSRYAPVDPRDWRFTPEGLGKPKISAPAEYCWLQFNLSHTTGLAACGVSRDLPVGVDVENLFRRQHRGPKGEPNDCLELARYCLADSEFNQLPDLEFSERWHRFLRFWTLKESYLKACATGISQPLKQFAFWWGPEPRIEFLSGQDNPHAWFFAEHQPTASHVAAAALKGVNHALVTWTEDQEI